MRSSNSVRRCFFICCWHRNLLIEIKRHLTSGPSIGSGIGDSIVVNSGVHDMVNRNGALSAGKSCNFYDMRLYSYYVSNMYPMAIRVEYVCTYVLR